MFPKQYFSWMARAAETGQLSRPTREFPTCRLAFRAEIVKVPKDLMVSLDDRGTFITPQDRSIQRKSQFIHSCGGLEVTRFRGYSRLRGSINVRQTHLRSVAPKAVLEARDSVWVSEVICKCVGSEIRAEMFISRSSISPINRPASSSLEPSAYTLSVGSEAPGNTISRRGVLQLVPQFDPTHELTGCGTFRQVQCVALPGEVDLQYKRGDMSAPRSRRAGADVRFRRQRRARSPFPPLGAQRYANSSKR